MAKSEARRQKQRAKKKAKRDDKRTELARLTSRDPLVRLAEADTWPIVEAVVPGNLWDQGIGELLIARRDPAGHLMVGAFLVDVWCLGVKNTFWKPMSESAYSDLLAKVSKHAVHRKKAPEYFAKLIYDAVAYAQSFGLPPHPDFRQTSMLLQGIDASLCSETFAFGKDGKPCYFRGPHESLEKAQRIARRIHEAGGEYIIPLKPGTKVRSVPDQDASQLEWEEGE